MVGLVEQRISEIFFAPRLCHLSDSELGFPMTVLLHVSILHHPTFFFFFTFNLNEIKARLIML